MYVEELPGANTQEKTLAEARENLQEAASLILVANGELVHRAAGKAEDCQDRGVPPP